MRKTETRPPAPEGSLRAVLQTLADERRSQGKVHALDGMLALAVGALLCGSRSWYAISQWGRERPPGFGMRRCAVIHNPHLTAHLSERLKAA